MKWGLLIVALLLTYGCKRDDMADQPRLKPLGAAGYFHDGAEAHMPPSHTVAVDAPLEGDPNDGAWQNATKVTQFPFAITRADLQRGQEQYQTNCMACHGMLGDGEGMVPQRGFVRPPSYHTDRLRNAPPSYFYDVMTKGIGAMFPAAERVKPDDRWRIAAYIKALQLAAYAPGETPTSASAGGAP